MLITIEDLRKKFGKKIETVEKWVMEDRVINYTVDENGEITAVVKGETDEYTVFITPLGLVSCSCRGQKTHRGICKHVLFLLFYSWIQGNLKLKNVEKILEVNT